MKYFLPVFFFLMGCSGTKVISIVGEKAAFQNYYTFRIQHPEYPEDPEIASKATLMRTKIDNAITIELSSRGYSKTEPADFKVSYKLILDNKVDYDQNNSYSRYRSNTYSDPYGYRYDPYYYGNETRYTEGILILEIREDYGNRAIWDGSLDLKYNNSKKMKSDPVTNAFHLIFAEYHYIAGKSDPVIPLEK